MTKEEKIIVSWQWRYHDLHCRILDLAKTLDPDNLEKLSRGFPDHISALKRFRQEAGWFEGIEKKVFR
jgi:hypothetical protein